MSSAFCARTSKCCPGNAVVVRVIGIANRYVGDRGRSAGATTRALAPVLNLRRASVSRGQGFRRLTACRGTARVRHRASRAPRRPESVVSLLCAAPVDAALLAVVDTRPPEVRYHYWARMWPDGVPASLADTVAAELLDAGRPLAAIWVLASAVGHLAVRPDLVVQALTTDPTKAPTPRAPAGAAPEPDATDDGRDDAGQGYDSPDDADLMSFVHHLDVTVPRLVEYLDAQGIDNDVLANIELRFLVVFEPEYRPAAHLHRALACSPAQFVEIAELALAKAVETEPRGGGAGARTGPRSRRTRRRRDRALTREISAAASHLPASAHFGSRRSMSYRPPRLTAATSVMPGVPGPIRFRPVATRRGARAAEIAAGHLGRVRPDCLRILLDAKEPAGRGRRATMVSRSRRGPAGRPRLRRPSDRGSRDRC